MITPSGVRSFGRQLHLLVGHGDVVDLQPAALDLTARLAGRGDKARLARRGENAEALVEVGALDLDGRQRFRERAFLESAARGLGRLIGRRAAMHQRGRLGGENLLRLVDLGALERRETRDLVERQDR